MTRRDRFVLAASSSFDSACAISELNYLYLFRDTTDSLKDIFVNNRIYLILTTEILCLFKMGK